MFSALLILGLVSAPIQLEKPVPFIGMAVAPYLQKTGPEGDGIKYHFDIGVPFQIKKLDWGFVDSRLMVQPELIFNSTLFAFNVGAGPDITFESGYRQIPSGYFMGAQLGLLYAYVSNVTTDPVTKIKNESDQSVYGATLNTYFGPYFDIRDWFQMRLQVNPKLIIGSIPSYTFNIRSNLGFLLGFHVQVFY